ncbi:MAG: hypothetical protein HKP58_06965 [Desulfatitalea sp.]|nr:hypothetical protein [Desulfatitalea sp.]NNK00137.1 hypothetical protein [Desulfatitalea sp.]
MSYILVAKPTDHKILFEWVDDITKMGQDQGFEFIDEKGRHHKYQWINNIPHRAQLWTWKAVSFDELSGSEFARIFHPSDP